MSTVARAAVAENPLWYHSIEVAPGVVTPGWFDLRPVVDKLPWPDVRGKRCLDVGTYDGFFAFELERRGAAEVVATDIADHAGWDWPVRLRAGGVEYLRALAGPRRGVGFRIARDLLGSSATLEELSVYDLAPDTIGEFDAIVCGSLLLHLSEPLRALAAIRSVCRGQFLSTNQVDLRPWLYRRRPLARLDGMSSLSQWWLPNPAGHRQMVRAAGFEIERESRLYSIPFGEAHPPTAVSQASLADRPKQMMVKLGRLAMTGNSGPPHHALLAAPATLGQSTGER